VAKRPLTLGEIRLAQDIFGAALPYDRVRFSDGAGGNPAAMAAFRNGNTAITLRRTVYFAPRRFRPDFTLGTAQDQELFAHEMTHVWQYARLGFTRFMLRYARELASVRFHAPALYRYQAGVTRFAEAKLEAQAQMAGEYLQATLEGQETWKAAIGRSLAGSTLYRL
jgi:hypothetical protein